MADNGLLSEGRALAEYWALQASAVFRGQDVPRGDGKLVLVLPGLFGNDFYLRPLREWLGRIGYRPAMSLLALNAGCPQRLLQRVQQNVAAKIAAHEGDVAIIGHSRGGMLGKALLTRLGGRVTHFVVLGSPLGALLRAGRAGFVQAAEPGASDAMARRRIVAAGRGALRLLDPDCDLPACACRYVDDLLLPLAPRVQVTSIYSSEDPIVAPAACRMDGAHNVEVRGSHGGLVFNKSVYPHIARALL